MSILCYNQSVWRLVATIGGAIALATLSGISSATTNVAATGFVAVTTGSGSLQISSFKIDGSGERRLTSGPSNHHYPSVSPDGAKLLYTGDEGGLDEVYMLNLAEPARSVRITNPPLRANSASWSPDGKSIVLSALTPGSAAYQLFIADPDGRNQRQLTHTVESGNAQPVFSPDGARIAFINGREETRAGPNGSAITGTANRIWVVGADGTGAAPLTAGPLDAYPAWLDSTTILFARSGFLSRAAQVVGVRLDGKEQVLSPSDQYFVEPRPAPDGTSYGATMESGTELHLVRISRRDGSALMRPGSSEYVIDRLPIPSADGSSFTMDWILGRAIPGAASRTSSSPVLALAVAGILVLVLVGSVSYRTGRKHHV